MKLALTKGLFGSYYEEHYFLAKQNLFHENISTLKSLTLVELRYPAQQDTEIIPRKRLPKAWTFSPLVKVANSTPWDYLLTRLTLLLISNQLI